MTSAKAPRRYTENASCLKDLLALMTSSDALAAGDDGGYSSRRSGWTPRLSNTCARWVGGSLSITVELRLPPRDAYDPGEWELPSMVGRTGAQQRSHSPCLSSTATFADRCRSERCLCRDLAAGR